MPLNHNNTYTKCMTFDFWFFDYWSFDLLIFDFLISDFRFLILDFLDFLVFWFFGFWVLVFGLSIFWFSTFWFTTFFFWLPIGDSFISSFPRFLFPTSQFGLDRHSYRQLNFGGPHSMFQFFNFSTFFHVYQFVLRCVLGGAIEFCV